ncbi:hypothetical protein BKA93DRAFT_301530 [Sparassis latifolia]
MMAVGRPAAAYLDDELAISALVAQLTVDDIHHLRSSNKGKKSALSGPTDEEVALQLYEDEARALLTITEDIVFARSVDSALDTDYALLEEIARAEAGAREDREMAVALSEGRPATSRSPTPASLLVSSDVLNNLLTVFPDRTSHGASRTLSFGPTDVSVPRIASSSKVVLHSTKSVARKREECVICTDRIDGVEIRAPCGHFYDVGCLMDLFRSATVDESLFPPRCCQQPFAFNEVRCYLGAELSASFEAKAVEFSTANRLYCHRPTCSAFLGSKTADVTSRTCLKCFSQTCGRCKEAAHGTLSCTDADDASILALAQEAGWKRCPRCRHMVELAIGCYHMTCRCRMEFCYVCTETWKNCTCPQWDETRLYAAAENRVQRQMPEVPQLQFHQMVAQVADRLRDDHDCRHTWRRRSGGGQCEQCHHHLRDFLLRCPHCEMLVCVRCRRNRM